MIDGVTVLNIIEGGISAGYLIAAFISLFLLIISILITIEDDRFEGLIVGSIIGFISFTCLTIFCPRPIEYEVTVDETVSFVEFTENYEIVEQRGNIYIIKLKEEQEKLRI